MKRFRLNWTARLGISAGVLAILLWIVPAGQLLESMGRVGPAVWAGVLGGFLLGHVVAAWKWRLLVAHAGHVPLVVALRAHFAGLLANLCLPGVAGGDVVRAAWLIQGIGHAERVGVGSVADRLLDCLGLLMLAALGALWSLGRGQSSAGPLASVAAALGLAVAALFAARLVLRRLATGGKWQKLIAALDELTARPGRLALCLALSLTVQGSFVGLNALLAQAAGLDLPLAAWALAWPLAKLVAIVPVSLAGLGVRESSLVALLAPYGAPAAAVTAVGLMWQAVLMAGGLIGGGVVLLSGGGIRPVAAPAEEAAA